MPKFNADEKVYEPIEVVLGGETYTIEEVHQDLLDKIKDSGKEAKASLDAGEEDIGIIYRQLGILLDTDPVKFKDVDIRKANAVLRFLTETITSQIEGKEGNG